MNENQINEFKDAVNDRIDLILDEPLAALGQFTLPIVCVFLVFGANALGVFSSVFPDAQWGLLTAMSAALYGVLMVAKMYATGTLNIFPAEGE